MSDELNGALWQAAHDGDLETVKECLARGADIDFAHPRKGSQVLFVATHEGHEEIVRHLIASGASMVPVTLHEAANFANHSLLQILLDGGADPNWAIPESNETALHVAACRGHRSGTTECVRKLLAAGANPSIHTKNGAKTATYGGTYMAGETPLHLAARFGDGEMVRLLVESGADPLAKDADGHQPRFWYARSQRSEDHPALDGEDRKLICELLPFIPPSGHPDA